MHTIRSTKESRIHIDPHRCQIFLKNGVRGDIDVLLRLYWVHINNEVMWQVSNTSRDKMFYPR